MFNINTEKLFYKINVEQHIIYIDFLMFVCTVTSHSFFLVPNGAPQNVECLPLSPESIRIRWRPPPQHYWNGILQGYKVSYRQSNPKPGKQYLKNK